MANKDLFAQAIADAKKLKEISMANAKQAIEEAFAPRIQEMFRLKLSEMEDDSMKDEGLEEMKHMEEEGMKEEGMKEEGINEMTLDEILAELELEEGMEEESPIEEGHTKADGYTGKAGKGGTGYDSKATTTHSDKQLHEAEDDDAEEEASAKEAGAESEEVAELSVEDFKNLVRDVVADVLASQGAGEGDLEGDETAAMGGEGDSEALSLDEILAELATEGDTGYSHGKQEPAIEESVLDTFNAFFDSLAGGGKMKDYEACRKELKPKQKELGFEGFIKALRQCVEQKAPGSVTATPHKAGMAFGVKEASELEEAIDTIETLKTELNEMNLLNAKLLYMNKLFKAKSLSEAQKVKVVAAFDRATTTKEAKNIFETLNESLNVATTTKKAPIKESLGFASKPIGNAPATPIVEADSYVYRMQQLAGIKKPNI